MDRVSHDPEKKVSRGAPRGEGEGEGLRVLEHVTEATTGGGELSEILQRVVEEIAQRTDTDVCSVYLLDPRAARLTLSATTGLDRSAVGKVSMTIGEGLTGMVIEKGEPVLVVDALTHPRYKYFPETGEERYHSFAGVPIVGHGTPLGVLVVQTLRRRRFSANETRLLRAIAGHVARVIVNARLVEEVRSKEQERREYRRRLEDATKRLKEAEQTIGAPRSVPARARARARARAQARLHGLAAAPGFGRGRAHLLQAPVSFDAVDERRVKQPTRELKRLARAVEGAAKQVVGLKERLVSRLPEFDAAVFDAHALMLEDRGFIEKVEARIREGFNAETALKHVVEEYLHTFAGMQDEYLRERAQDVKDVGLRLLRNLLGVEEQQRTVAADSVLVAEEITISDLVLIDHRRLRGIVLATGGVTSHATILAKSFEIPTVVGAEGAIDVVNEGDDLLVDGNAGAVFVNPGSDVLREYERLDREYRAFNRELDTLRDRPAETTDGHRVRLFANIGLVADLPFVRRHGADGVGLYRTEFPFLTYREFPDEEEQYQLYRRVVQGLDGLPITIRTLDVGADKYPSYLTFHHEENPFLGWRSIRVSLEQPELFKVQLRAILRAAVHGPVRILLPMISSIEEVRRAAELLEEAKEELERQGRQYETNVPLGMMVEVPSAVTMAMHLVREVDFLSIGTNDLIQYLLAVDRNNHKVASLYEPLHPAVLAAIHQTVQAAKGLGKWVGICGEMASDPICSLVLLGMGLDDLSMSSFFIPVIKRIVRSVSTTEVRALARDLLSLPTVKEVKGHLFDGMKSLGIIELMEMYH
jgi:phosphotransferase system enzyme I (PtsP)